MMNNTCLFKLTDSERDRLGNVLSRLAYDPHGGMAYITDLRIAALSALPRRIVDALSEQRASINPRSHLLFDNLPTDEQIFAAPDPNIYTPGAKSGHISENLIMAFASLIGEPYSILFEGADIVNNLIPTKQAKREYTGLGSEVELDFHIENAALKFMDDYNFSPLGLLLTGVRHDPKGPLTRLADARLALRKLSHEEVECLRMPLYRIKVPYRWRRGSTQQTEPVALVRGTLDLPEISAVFYPDMVEPVTSAAAAAMKSRVHDRSHEHHERAGDEPLRQWRQEILQGDGYRSAAQSAHHGCVSGAGLQRCGRANRRSHQAVHELFGQRGNPAQFDVGRWRSRVDDAFP